jgi:ABC-type lipoprotein release transport system permease subunit
MSTFIKIAWRNIARSPARSLITVSAIAIGLCSLIFLNGFISGADQQMVENYTDLLIGHVQIHKTGFQKSMSIEKSMGNLETIKNAIRKTPQTAAFSERVKDFALISSPESSAGILLLGVDPVSEIKVSTIHRRLRKGEFLKKGDDNKILIGAQLSDNLKAGLGDKVVIMSQASDGSVAAAAYEVAGIIETGAEEIDKGLAMITLKAAQDLFVLNGKVSEIVLKLNSLDEVDAVTGLLREKIDQKKFEVLNWKEISPQIYQWLQFDAVFTSLILFIVLLVVATGILNTILMAVLERTREFGIMLALGTRPGQVVFTVAAESFFLGLIGTSIGALLGTCLVIFFGTNGIDLSAVSSALNNFYVGSVIYTRLDHVSIAIYSLIVLAVSIIISIIPALKASRLSPIEAIRHI